ncbi:MAG: hypothetical protein U9N72_05500 [Bacteroidota bacterium]|nr:hypothetical protein [Bacteroidota bacterium]
MNWSVLRKLLEKYYDGMSSKDDEKKMLELLSQDDLPSEFYEDRMMITGLFESEDIPEPSPDLNYRIMTAINESEKSHRIISGKKHLYSIASVAATILLIISLLLILENKNRIKDTYSDPQLAYNETVEVLYRVSENLNKGRTQMEDLSLINETKSRLNMISESRDAVVEELEALKYIENSLELFGVDKKSNINEKN